MKYKDWLHDWLDNYIKPSSKTKTCARYTEIVERHIIPHLGDVELDELTALVIQRYVTHLSTNGNDGVHRVRSKLFSRFQIAVGR